MWRHLLSVSDEFHKQISDGGGVFGTPSVSSSDCGLLILIQKNVVNILTVICVRVTHERSDDAVKSVGGNSLVHISLVEIGKTCDSDMRKTVACEIGSR